MESKCLPSMASIFRSHAVLDADGRHMNGTDKQSNHSYGDAYESLFPDRSTVELMMEVGVADGACLRAWRDIFPNATCVGMDIHHSDLAHGPRIEFHLGSQWSREDCEKAAAGRQFDLIVEDAVHHLADTLVTLFWLWPFVKMGGLYVVEEWEGAGGDRERIKDLFPNVRIVGTSGPHIKDEPLIVLKKVPPITSVLMMEFFCEHGLHISDGISPCSGEDWLEMEAAAASFSRRRYA